MPRHDRAYGRFEKLAYKRLPGLQRIAREAIYWGRESFVLGFAFQPKILLAAQRIAASQHREVDRRIPRYAPR